MHTLMIITVALHLQSWINSGYGKSDEQEFFKKCPPSRCDAVGPEIRYPFRLSTQSSDCGIPGMELFCSGMYPILEFPNDTQFKVLFIDYYNAEIIVELGDALSFCPVNNLTSINLTSINLTTEIFQPLYQQVLVMSCPKHKINQSDSFFSREIGPIPCLSNSTQLTYMVFGTRAIYSIPDCVVLSNNHSIPVYYNFFDLREGAGKHFIAELQWYVPDVTEKCKVCEEEEKHCAPTKSFCSQNSWSSKIIGATTSTGFVALLLVIALLWYRYRSRTNYSDHEELLAKYGNKLARYNFVEIKNITKRFQYKLGQGGYGSVFKGELSNGLNVAVKILENSNIDSDGKDFINEVATIGTIHHFNVVRLLGFCSEGSKRALVYEFMPNGSLDKYISTRTENNATRTFHMKTLLEIATGVANGIKYLHEGCNHRILHFDIKPHNILLDHNMNPKISDFGLAKLCSDDRSNITITAAKGTIGYMAPEVYSRNFGNVSYKSDVYSFGMLILKMVLGEKNLQPDVPMNSEVYYPEFIYEKLSEGQDVDSVIQVESTTEADIVKKLIIVAFWCIQWNPEERPHMTRVVQMLASDLHNLEMPAKPFAS